MELYQEPYPINKFITDEQLKPLLLALEEFFPIRHSISSPKHSDKFLQHFSCNQDNFTPLTYAILWDTGNIDITCPQFKNILESTDSYQHTPLNLALNSGAISLACKLIDNGCIITIRDKVIAETLLITALQYDPQNFNKIIAKLTEPSPDIIDYLHFVNLQVAPSKENNSSIAQHLTKFRNIFTPKPQNNGGALQVTCLLNGVYSEFSFIEQAILDCRKHLQHYYSTISTYKQETFILLTAINKLINIVKFQGLWQQNSEAAKQMHEIAIKNINGKETIPCFIPSGCASCSIIVVIYHKWLIIHNVGLGGDLQNATKIFLIDNPKNLSIQWIEVLLNSRWRFYCFSHFLQHLSWICSSDLVASMPGSAFAKDNACYNNLIGCLHSLMWLILLKENNIDLNTGKCLELKNTAHKWYKSYTDNFNDYYLHMVFDAVNNIALSKKQRYLNAILLLNYLQQQISNPSNKELLRQAIEIKNTLEVNGMKSHYQELIAPHIKKLLRDYTINQQEFAALYTIRTQNQMIREAILAEQQARREEIDRILAQEEEEEEY